MITRRRCTESGAAGTGGAEVAEQDDVVDRLRRLESRVARVERQERSLRGTTAALSLGLGGSVVSMSLTWLGDEPYFEAEQLLGVVDRPGLNGWNLMFAEVARPGGSGFFAVVLGVLPLLTALFAALALRSSDPRASRRAMVVGGLTTVVVGGLYAVGLLMASQSGTVVGSGWLMASVAAVVVTLAAYAQAQVLREEQDRKPPPRTGVELLGPPVTRLDPGSSSGPGRDGEGVGAE